MKYNNYRNSGIKALIKIIGIILIVVGLLMMLMLLHYMNVNGKPFLWMTYLEIALYLTFMITGLVLILKDWYRK